MSICLSLPRWCWVSAHCTQHDGCSWRRRNAPKQQASALRVAALVLLFILLVLAGCSSLNPPETQTESAMSSAAGVAEPIAFRVEGGPRDEVGDPQTLTLDEAVRLAVTTDPSVQAALARVRIALAEAKQSRLLPNPLLNLALRFPEGGGSPVFEASLAQDLISILRIPRQSSAADNRLRQASADAITATIDIVSQTQERYVTAQALERLLPVFAARQELATKVLNLTKARLDAGEGTREDVAVLQSQHVELQIEIAQTDQGLRDERLRLARLIGRPSSEALWRLQPWTPPSLTDVRESAWINAGLAARPEIQAAAWKLSALGDDVALAQLLPWDGLGAGVRAEHDGHWSVGPEVTVPIPIFDTGQARGERATAEQIQARHELADARRRVIEEVRRAYESLSRSRAILSRTLNELIPLQEQRRTLAEASFKAGQSDATAIYLAEHDLRAAQAKAVELERQACIAAIELQRAVGGPGPAEIARRTNIQTQPAMTQPRNVNH